jgi:hypothetical protein
VLAGHRLRLALSTSYWPIVWPAPEAAEITLHLEDCALVLPERRVEVEIDAQAPGAARDYPRYQAQVLEKPWGEATTKIEADGTHVLESYDSYGAARDLSHGQQVSSNVRMRYAIHPDDPASARFDCAWVFAFGRETDGDAPDWNLRIETDSAMWCDTETFTLWREIKAFEGEDLILTRDWKEVIPRGCH